MIDIHFSNDHDKRQVGDVMSVLARPRLWIPTNNDYPRHSAWLEKSEAEITTGQRRAMLGYVGKIPVGAIVYRQHAQREKTVEIRNISIDPSVHRQLFGSFMLRQVETDASQNDYVGANMFSVDTKVTNTGMLDFLERQGYTVTDVIDIYNDGTGEDAILTKSLIS